MTRGWGAIARACRPEGGHAIHFEYDGAPTLFFKVFGEDGRCLECCPRGGDRGGEAADGELALGLVRDSSNSRSASSEHDSSDDDSYEPSCPHHGSRVIPATLVTPRPWLL